VGGRTTRIAAMHRAIPVGNKVCAARVRKRYEDQRAQRLRDMKSQIDTRPPETTGMPHLKTNYKRDEMLNQRHDTIERDNRIMLTKMHDFARKAEVPRSTSLPLLRNECPGGPAQQREYDRITHDNYRMLNRLNNMQGELNVRRFEDSWSQGQNYLKIACEYPLILQKKKSRSRNTPSRAGLTRLPAEQQMQQQVPPADCAEDLNAVAGDLDDGMLRYVIREERPVGDTPFFVEMATDGQRLAISIYDAASGRGFELLVSEDNHRALLEESGWNYNLIADRLRVDGDRLVIVPLTPGTAAVGAAAAAATAVVGGLDGDPPSAMDANINIHVEPASSSSSQAEAMPGPPPPYNNVEDPISSSVVDVQDVSDVALDLAGDAAAPVVQDVVHQASTEESRNEATAAAAAAAAQYAGHEAEEDSDGEVDVDIGSDSGQSL